MQRMWVQFPLTSRARSPTGRGARVCYTVAMPRKRTWTDEQLVDAVVSSRSAAEVLNRLGLKLAGGSYENLYLHIDRLGLSTSHFTGMGWSRGMAKTPQEVLESLLPVLKLGNEVSKLRNRLIASGLKQPKCEECGIVEWCGKPAPLQVDHTNGNHFDNRLENLRILCANCHQQTETWGFKGARRRKPR